ncbi:autotransporter-associated beta strand repeat-containing protein [Luteolibacter yonseiensis]|uniref:Autotransporter-associated beta strand repeat-containing protein n=1 Tax=Luteolibacter yonseiensis TaxID=1144680 RepID=A0A934R6G1_9BACT|nr:LamG-like jellyroll fold domain-containing protein [Luteolibacter yonseiensis]MBK1817829.1 autotransporter-associated beta strand repeat-containing protein [Luteolibacter yonseiensis]
MSPNRLRTSLCLSAAWFACGTLCAAAAEVAGTLLVELDAADFRTGAVKWPQHSQSTGIPGDFVAKGSPTVQTVAGATAVVFDGDGDYFVGPMTTAALHAVGARHSVEIWVFQGNIRDQESVVSWGKRQGPDLTFAGFRYGADPDFGAIARWGACESAFEDLPPPGMWHHLVYTYDGVSQAVYVDGKLDNTKTVSKLDAHDMLPIHLGVELSGDMKPEGQFTHFSGALAKLRIHSGALDAVQVKQNFAAEHQGFPGLVAKPLQQSPMHRFSFNAPAGPAPNGTAVVDSIGGLSAVIRGEDAEFNGREIRLPGGSSATEAYIDLPNGIISSRESLSIEFWGTQDAAQDWCRILSIGTNSVGEIYGPGGVFTGTETLTLFGNVGATQVNRFARSYGTYPNGGPDRNPADYPDSDYGVEFHQVIIYDKELKEWRWYRNGILMEVIADNEGPTTIHDLNVWLGRSEFSSDNNFRGRFDEFRIYNHTLSEGEIYGNFLAGPDKLNLGGEVVAMNWALEAPGVHTYANSAGSDHWQTGANGPHPDGPGNIATFASALAGDQEIELSTPVTLGSLNLGTRNRGGAFTLRAKGAGALTMNSGNGIPASITQLQGSPGNLIYSPVRLLSNTEVTNQSTNPLLLGGGIQGEGSFIKGGSGTVILTGDGQAHTGEVRIVAGALVLGDAGKSGMLGGKLFTITDPGRLVFNRSDDIVLAGNYTGSGRIVHQGMGTLTVSKNGVMSNTGVIELCDGSGTFINDGEINGANSLQTDSELILHGASRTQVTEFLSAGVENGGILRLRDAATVSIEGRGHLNIGDTGGGQSVFHFDGGTIRCKEVFVGKDRNTSGVVLQTGGSLEKTGGGDSIIGGYIPDAWQVWGAWRMTGGKVVDEWNFQIGAHGTGIMEVDGGEMSIAGFLSLGRYEDEHQHASRGLLDVRSGRVSTTGDDKLLLVGEEGIGVLNIRKEGSVVCANRMIIGSGTISKPGEGTVNLLTGGSLTVDSITQFNQTEAIGRLNFDGGTLRAGNHSAAFFDGLDYVHVREGGARIDTNGFDVKIGQSLTAPRGNGILSIPILDNGSGYVGPPWIEISGGAGSGATALAELENGSVKSILLTNAGYDFLNPPGVSVIGGGSGGGLKLGTPVLTPSGSGGLVKLGDGKLTLAGDNTYTGVTSVKQGGLRLEGSVLGAVKLEGGTLLEGGGAIGSMLSAEPGSTVAPDPGATLTIRGDADIRGTLRIEVSGAGGGAISVAGTLDLSSAKFLLRLPGDQPASPVMVIASYGMLEGRFTAADGLPKGYHIDYHHNGSNQIALVTTGSTNNGD